MCSIILNATYVFVCRSILDATVDAIMAVLVGEILPKITVSSVVYFLVMVVPLLVVAASVLSTAVTTSRLFAVVVGRATTRSW